MKTSLFAAVAAFAVASAFAGAWDSGKTWFVATNGVDTAIAEGGGTEATPFRTLQFAHDQASAGDTIKLTPGVYAEGEVGDGTHTNRLVVAKKLRFCSTGGKADTIIEGRMDPASGSYGVGAIRCVCVMADGYDSEFHDLTFRGGAGGAGSSTAADAIGGCVRVEGAFDLSAKADIRRAFFVDCVIAEGVTQNYGGGICGGTLIRCLLRDCKSVSWGSSASGAALWNCVVVGDCNTKSSRPAVGHYSIIVNCTIYGGTGEGCNNYIRAYNTYIANMGGAEFGGTTGSSRKFYSCVGGADTNNAYQVVSPATGDFRPVADTPIVGGGLTGYLTDADVILLPENTEMTDFNGNPLDLDSTTCNVGAVQGAGVAVATGAIVVKPGETVEGHLVPGTRTSYSLSETFPATLVLRPASSNFHRLDLSTGYSKTLFLCTQPDGTIHLGYPPPSVPTRSITEVESGETLWTDPAANAEEADGSEAHPYRTLQAAMDFIAATNWSKVVVLAKPGTYAEGGAVTNGILSRVVLPNRSMLIRSTGGAAVTFIQGAADEDSTSTSFPGCGPNAVRCVALPVLKDTYRIAIQGFTFKGGRTDCSKNGASEVACDTGAGIYADCVETSTRLLVTDCVFDDLVAPCGAAVKGGLYQRCRFGNVTSWLGVTKNARMSSCLFYPTCRYCGSQPEGATAEKRFYASYSEMVHCTSLNGTAYSGSTPRLYMSTVFVNSEGRGGNYYYYGSIFDTATCTGSGSGGYVKADVDFADADNGDYRLVSTSPATWGGTLPKETASYRSYWETDYSEFVTSDLDGRRIRYNADGIPLTGCYQTLAYPYEVSAANGGVRIEGYPGDGGYLPEGEPVTVEHAPEMATRPYLGFVVNGVTNLVADTKGSTTLTYDEICKAGGFKVESLYGTDWYVNCDPNVGDDGHSGATPQQAKRTLCGVMDADVRSGDTVHAAPGRYAEGESRAQGATHPPERVRIPGGVTLVSDEGAEKTFIVGRLGSDSYTDSIGCGSNSVRCVSMGEEAVLRGFTLTDGSAYPAPSAGSPGIYGEPYNHGAVWAGGRHTTFVVDCVVSNCAAYNAAAGREVCFVNTLITGNRAWTCIMSECDLLGCVVDGNFADTASLNKFTYVYDTTIGPHAYKLDGTKGTGLGSYSTVGAGRLMNCLVLSKCTTSSPTSPLSNCVFAAGCENANVLKKTNDCWVVDADLLQVDADCRPIAGMNFACDKADPTLISGRAAEDAYLLELRERANNGGRLDIGALEADWRGRYAEDILGRKFAVESADKMVEEAANGTVLVPEGTSLVGEILNRSARETPYLLKFLVPEDGSLTVTVDGQAKDYAAGTHEITVNATAATLPVSFASTAGTAAILRGKSLAGIVLLVR